MSLIPFTIILPWLIVGLFVALSGWIGFQLIQQNGRLLSRLEALEARLAQLSALPMPAPSLPAAAAPSPPQAPPPPGLPIGALAPAFDLPDLDGGRRSLAQFYGRELLLIFFNPRCGFCSRMAPDIAALSVDGPGGGPLPLVISVGSIEENRKLVEERGIRCPVLLQEQMEVASQYQCHGTPMGYRIDAEGRIASELAVGAEALLAAAAPLPAKRNGRNGHAPGPVEGNGHAALGGKRSVAESKLNRGGLPAGTPAPRFRLARLEGGELSLDEYRGRKALLVFSDPKCGPCDQLMPELERWHRASAAVQVLMVSRGEEAANRAKAAQHGLTFPIGLQQQWEVSRDYAMFGTPIAYLIDEEGVIAADVAVGAEPIRALLAGAAAPANGETERQCRCGKPLGQCNCSRQRAKAAAGSRGGQ